MFRPGTFDGAISISAVQWLCNSNSTAENPYNRLYIFFTTLYSCLKRGAKVILQIYPESPQQAELLTRQATRAGFNGGLMVDFPNSSKAKKIYMVLSCGDTSFQMPNPLGMTPAGACVYTRNDVVIGGRVTKKLTGKAWVKNKKERMRRQGKVVCSDSKYSGRKRSQRYI